MPSSCLLSEHTGWGVLAAASVLVNFLMRHLFPVLPNCSALFSLFGSFSSSSFYHALFILSFKMPHHPYITRICLTCLRRGWPQFSPFITDAQSGRCCGTYTSPDPQEDKKPLFLIIFYLSCPELGRGTGATQVPSEGHRVALLH